MYPFQLSSHFTPNKHSNAFSSESPSPAPPRLPLTPLPHTHCPPSAPSPSRTPSLPHAPPRSPLPHLPLTFLLRLLFRSTFPKNSSACSSPATPRSRGRSVSQPPRSPTLQSQQVLTHAFPLESATVAVQRAKPRLQPLQSTQLCMKRPPFTHPPATRCELPPTRTRPHTHSSDPVTLRQTPVTPLPLRWNVEAWWKPKSPIRSSVNASTCDNDNVT